jgi:hypothetical protein
MGVAPPQGFIVVTGTTRAGTTMLRLMLGHHPELADLGEAEWLCGDNLASPDDERVLDWETLVRREAGYEDFRLDRSSSEHPVRQALAHRWRTLGVGKIQCAVVFHRHYNRVREMFPEAYFIHLTRDPRDVVASWLRLGWVGHARVGGRQWADSQKAWREARSLIPSDRVFEMRFEALIQDPPTALQAALQRIGLEYDPRMLSYPNDSTYELPDPREAHKWKSKADEKYLAECEQGVGLELEQWGYERSTNRSLRRQQPFQTQTDRIANQLAMQRAKIEKFGFRVWAGQILGRRLKIRSLHRWAENEAYWVDRRARK